MLSFRVHSGSEMSARTLPSCQRDVDLPALQVLAIDAADEVVHRIFQARQVLSGLAQEAERAEDGGDTVRDGVHATSRHASEDEGTHTRTCSPARNQTVEGRSNRPPGVGPCEARAPL